MLKEQLRRDAAQIIDRAIQAVRPDEAVHRALNPVMFPGRVVLVAVIVIFVLVDAQLFPHLPDIGRVNLEAILLLDVLLDVIVAENLASIGFQVGGIHGNAEIVADLLCFGNS